MVLSNIRKRSGLLIIVIGIAMLGFILTDLMNSGTSLFQKGQNVLLKLGDTELMFTTFEKELEENINIKFASNLGSVNIDQQQRNSERDLLWDQKIKEILLEEKFQNSGIVVGKTEIWDLISGEISGQQAQLFGYFFREQTESGDWNSYNPEMIQNWIEMGSDNPQWFRYLFFKNNTVRDRSFLKYYNAVKQGLYVTKNEAKSYYIEQTEAVQGKYIYIANDDFIVDVNVTEKEIKNYYKNNKSKFPNSPNREITYFMFDLKPSNQDKNDMLKEISDLVSDRQVLNRRTNVEEIDLGFQNTESLENFINQYGDNKYEIVKLAVSDVDKKNITNNIILPYIEKNRCKVGRIIESTVDTFEIVYLEREIYASDQTLNELYSKVYEIINKNKKIEDLNIITELSNISPRTVVLEKMDQSVPGLGLRREIVRWAFNEETNLNEPNFFDLEDKYIISVLTNISEDETKQLSDVYDDIKNILINKLASDRILEKIDNLKLKSLEQIANNFKVQVKSINNLRMNSDVFGDTGANPALVGSFFGLPEDKLSEPFISDKGVFLFNKAPKGSINYPSNWDRYQDLIKKKIDSEVDALLVDILQEEKQFIDNRFNFY